MKLAGLMVAALLATSCATKKEVVKEPTKPRKVTRRQLRNACIERYLGQVNTPEEAARLCKFVVRGE